MENANFVPVCTMDFLIKEQRVGLIIFQVVNLYFGSLIITMQINRFVVISSWIKHVPLGLQIIEITFSTTRI